MIKRILGGVGSLALILLATLLVFMLVEGGASLWQIFAKAKPAGQVAERVHTQYDPLLGWTNLPGSNRPNMYGPGVGLKINSQGLRADEDYAHQPPAGRVRVVCSGDSFTMGYGVSNPDTWPAAMQALRPQIQTVNMGMGGYGLGQSYLWYLRDGHKLKHQIHLMAFITPDIQRMSYDVFLGYPKPYLTLRGHTLVKNNVPVPNLPFMIPALVRYRHSIGDLRIMQALRTVVPSTFRSGKPQPVLPVLGTDVVHVAYQCLVNLNQNGLNAKTRFAVVWLPIKREYRDRRWDDFRSRLKGALAKHSIPVIDLVEAYRQKVAPEDVDRLFIGKDILQYTGAAGHYSTEGNRFFAGLVLDQLLQREPFATLLAAAPGQAQTGKKE